MYSPAPDSATVLVRSVSDGRGHDRDRGHDDGGDGGGDGDGDGGASDDNCPSIHLHRIRSHIRLLQLVQLQLVLYNNHHNHHNNHLPNTRDDGGDGGGGDEVHDRGHAEQQQLPWLSLMPQKGLSAK